MTGLNLTRTGHTFGFKLSSKPFPCQWDNNTDKIPASEPMHQLSNIAKSSVLKAAERCGVGDIGRGNELRGWTGRRQINLTAVISLTDFYHGMSVWKFGRSAKFRVVCGHTVWKMFSGIWGVELEYERKLSVTLSPPLPASHSLRISGRSGRCL